MHDKYPAYTRREAAKTLCVSVVTIDRMCRDGRLGTSKVGATKLISGADVAALLPKPARAE
jgi:excisionase family DNA binding protein